MHLVMFWIALAAPVTRCTFASSRTPRHADRMADAFLAVDHVFLRLACRARWSAGIATALAEFEHAVEIGRA